MKKFIALSIALVVAFSCSLAAGGLLSHALESASHFSAHPIHAAQIAPFVIGSMFIASVFIVAPKNALFDTPFTVGLCEKIQTTLNDLLGNNAPELMRTEVGYLQALTSPQNTAGVTYVPVDPGNGKNKKVRITWIQRGTDDNIVTSEPANCDPEVFQSPLETDIAVTKYIGTKWFGFNENDMRKLCEDDASYRGRVMSAQIDALMVKLDKQLITLQSANFGAFNPVIYTGYKDVTMINTAGDGITYIGEANMKEDFRNLNATAKPLVIGAGNLSLYSTMAKIGCCNQLGQDLSNAAADIDFFRDRYVDQILGANHFIGLIPGFVHLLTWNKYVGNYRKETPTFSKGTIMDAFTGLTLDMKWEYKSCEEQYAVQFSLNYELWFIPTDSFAEGDELEGVNFTLHYRAVQNS